MICPLPGWKWCLQKRLYKRKIQHETEHCPTGYAIFWRRNNGAYYIIFINLSDNRSLVPYNPYLSKKCNAHTNVEICSTVQAVKYLYKHIYKGHDKVQAKAYLQHKGAVEINEPKLYIDGRYVSFLGSLEHIGASNASWTSCSCTAYSERSGCPYCVYPW